MSEKNDITILLRFPGSLNDRIVEACNGSERRRAEFFRAAAEERLARIEAHRALIGTKESLVLARCRALRIDPVEELERLIIKAAGDKPMVAVA